MDISLRCIIIALLIIWLITYNINFENFASLISKAKKKTKKISSTSSNLVQSTTNAVQTGASTLVQGTTDAVQTLSSAAQSWGALDVKWKEPI